MSPKLNYIKGQCRIMICLIIVYIPFDCPAKVSFYHPHTHLFGLYSWQFAFLHLIILHHPTKPFCSNMLCSCLKLLSIIFKYCFVNHFALRSCLHHHNSISLYIPSLTANTWSFTNHIYIFYNFTFNAPCCLFGVIHFIVIIQQNHSVSIKFIFLLFI